VIGVTDTSLVEAVRLAATAKDCGATAIATAPPFYYSVTQSEILHYCEKLIEQVNIPLLLYNAPGNTHHTLSLATVCRAAQIENVIGLKDSGMNMGYFHEVKAALNGRKDFSLLVGPEELLAECVLLGGHGGMAAGSNVYPRLFVDTYNACVEGDMPRVRELQAEIMAFGKAVYRANPLRGLKCGLELLGICNSLLTEPLAPYSAQESESVAQYIILHRSNMLSHAA
jgi:4-hydroxy-tetrahydrodipicolinate synthase